MMGKPKQLKEYERREAIRVLGLVRELVAGPRDSGSWFVCIALGRVACEHPWNITGRMVRHLQAWVRSMLDSTVGGGPNTLESWLKMTHFGGTWPPGVIARDGTFTEDAKKRFRATRLAWIDWMIRELEAGR